MSNDTESAIMGAFLDRAIPISPTGPPVDYVTRNEFEAKLSLIETKIEGEAVKTKLWVVLGVLAIIGSFGGGYVSLMAKIERISEALPKLADVQDGRREWIQLQDQRDSLQDGALKRLDGSYQPLPYQASPQ